MIFYDLSILLHALLLEDRIIFRVNFSKYFYLLEIECFDSGMCDYAIKPISY